MNLNLEIINANIGHTRLIPKKNSFSYRVFYVKIPVTKENTVSTPQLFSIDRWNVFSVMRKDHGAKDKNVNWCDFITSELKKASIPFSNTDNVYLCCFPRIFGYAFNPIAYWLIVDKDEQLRAVLCEVRNTFKQNHNYLLVKDSREVIYPEDILISDKKLYVSPFNNIEGKYEFSFSYSNKKFKSVINYYDASGEQLLNTYMGGNIEELTSRKLFKTLITYPAMTITVVFRIHWQAVRLYLKKVRPTLRTRPKIYTNNRTTVSRNIKH